MKNEFKMMTAMLIFGSIGLFVRNIDLPSIEVAFLRAAIASVFLAFMSLRMGGGNTLERIKPNRLWLILSGTAIGLNWICLFQGYQYTTISNATLSYYFAPIFVLILSPIILKEKLTSMKVLCVLASMVGLSLLMQGEASGVEDGYQHIKGIGYGLLGAGLYASVILMNKYIKNLSGFETTLVQLSVGALVLLPMVYYRGQLSITQMNLSSWLFILILGVVHTGFAYVLYFSSIKELKGQSIAILSYIDPIFAVILAAVILGEGMGIQQFIGGILILGATFVSEKEKIFVSKKKRILEK